MVHLFSILLTIRGCHNRSSSRFEKLPHCGAYNELSYHPLYGREFDFFNKMLILSFTEEEHIIASRRPSFDRAANRHSYLLNSGNFTKAYIIMAASQLKSLLLNARIKLKIDNLNFYRCYKFYCLIIGFCLIRSGMQAEKSFCYCSCSLSGSLMLRMQTR